MASSEKHPIRRIRESFRGLSEESGMGKYATSRGFALFIERSPSLIRNVENNITAFSEKLAKHIEWKTGVSATWMLDPDARNSDILGTNGKKWNPEECLDPHGSVSLDLKALTKVSPERVARFVGKLVEARIKMDIEKKSLVSLNRTVAQISAIDGITDTDLKPIFASVVAENEAGELLAMWDFAKEAWMLNPREIHTIFQMRLREAEGMPQKVIVPRKSGVTAQGNGSRDGERTKRSL